MEYCGKMGAFVRLFSVSLVLIICAVRGAQAAPKVLPACKFPAIFNFGDSNSDTGGASATIHPTEMPNGITFFKKPAGRACDGRLIIDFIANQLRLPFLNAYLDSAGTTYRGGANFAVAGATIRQKNDTLPLPFLPFYLEEQIEQYDAFKAQALELHNQGSSSKNSTRRRMVPMPQVFSKALYTIDIGQNDLVRTMNGAGDPQLVIQDMVHQVSLAVRHLYEQGGRTFWVHNTGPDGCLPVFANNIPTLMKQKLPAAAYDRNGCIKKWNEWAMEYNRQLKERVIKLRAELPEAAITYVDVYRVKYGLIANATNQGFTDPFQQCLVNDQFGKPTVVCEDPSKHISWDGGHYTEAANQLFAKSILNGSLSDPPLIPITHACAPRINL